MLFLAGTVLTAAGMAELPMAAGIDTDGARVLTSIAGLVVAIGAVLWIVSLIGRLVVTTDVASAFVAGTGEATPVPAERLMGGLFGASSCWPVWGSSPSGWGSSWPRCCRPLAGYASLSA